VQFESIDLEDVVILKDTKRLFPVAFAEKLAKINRERVYVNAFLPELLQMQYILVSVQPIPNCARWQAPRDFLFAEETGASDFLRAFPELFDDIVGEQVHEILSLLRRGNVQQAEVKLERLNDVREDLSSNWKSRVYYNLACAKSMLAAQALEAGTRAQKVQEALSALKMWIDLGLSGYWVRAATPVESVIFQMKQDPDLSLLFSEHPDTVRGMFPSKHQNSFDPEQPN
jgi:hypothetical protein